MLFFAMRWLRAVFRSSTVATFAYFVLSALQLIPAQPASRSSSSSSASRFICKGPPRSATNKKGDKPSPREARSDDPYNELQVIDLKGDGRVWRIPIIRQQQTINRDVAKLVRRKS